jgi:hypothetical protein
MELRESIAVHAKVFDRRRAPRDGLSVASNEES